MLPTKDFVHDKFAKRFKILTLKKKKKKKKHHWVLFHPALVSVGRSCAAAYFPVHVWQPRHKHDKH